MKIKPKIIAIPRVPKKLVKPLLPPEATGFPVPLDGVLFEILDGEEETGVPGN